MGFLKEIKNFDFWIGGTHYKGKQKEYELTKDSCCYELEKMKMEGIISKGGYISRQIRRKTYIRKLGGE